jgi:hypothetical protein
MAKTIFPSKTTRQRVPRFAFPDCSPPLYGLDAVRGMTVIQSDDEDFRAWRLARKAGVQ